MTSRLRLLPIGLVAGGALALAVTSSVSAHVGIAEQEAAAGAFTLLTFGVPHGCEESPTTRVRIQMPESIPQVTPTVNANWDVEKVMTAKTPLPADLRDAFVLSGQVPEDAAGTTLYFPTIQECEQGETAWIEIPADGQDGEELEAPAPSIAVVAAAAGDGHDEEAANGAADEATDVQEEAAAEAATSDDDVGGVALARSRRT